MKKVTALIVFVALGIGVTAFAAPGKTTTVFGTGNMAVDRANLQSAIDAAPKNGTVELVGTFQLDGNLVFIRDGHITVEGRAIDNDGDGAVNEDWADGVDNDGDGAVDEDDWDAEIRGLLDGFGEPEDDILFPTREFHNRGLTVWGATDTIDKVRIRNIKFYGLNRGVEFAPSFDSGGTLFCADVTSTPGRIVNSVVEGNWFDNVDRGFEIFGESNNVHVKDNLFTNVVRSFATGVVGVGTTCFNADNTGSALPIGVPHNTKYSGNRFFNSEFQAILTAQASGTEIRDNVIDGALAGVDMYGDEGAHIVNNEISDTDYGIVLDGPLDQQLAAHNTIINSTFYGFWFVEAVDGTALNNAFSGSGIADYYLDAGSSDNKVRTKKGQLVIDLGTDNDIK